MRTDITGKAVVVALVAFALMVSSAQAAQLNNITVGRSQDFTVVTLYGDAPVSVSHQAIEAKGGKPNRIVVDLTGVEHALPRNNFDELPEGSIARIRTSQFAVSPEPVVRVVLDLATAAAYKLETQENNVRIMVSLPSDPPMANVWSAKNVPVIAQFVPASPAVEAGESGPSAAEPTFAPSATLAQVNDETPSSVPMEPMAAAPVMPSATPPNAAPEAEPKATEQAKEPAKATNVGSATAATKIGDVPPASPDAPGVPLPMPKLQGAQVIDYNFPRPGTMAEADAPAQTGPAEPAPAPKKAAVKQAVSEPAGTEAPAPEPLVAQAEPPAESGDEASVQSATEPRLEPKRAITRDQAGPEPGAPVMPVAPERTDEYSESLDGSAPLASLTTLPPMESDVSAVVPSRSKIVYHTNGRRDPFLPLLQIGAAYNAAALPDVGNLRLVGLLHDVEESWGLFEDANGFGYILRKGDPVRNGRLNKLTQSRAYFQLNEFGWSRSVELELEPEG